jgi:hypothetical protein
MGGGWHAGIIEPSSLTDGVAAFTRWMLNEGT